jgi:HAD superfamily hydrolase (TIGR01509 family)
MPEGTDRLPARQGCGMTAVPTPPAAVLFDCDGVLADSEGLVNAIVAADLATRGWRMTPAECQEQFLGMAATDMVPVIQARVGSLPADWLSQLSHRIAHSMIAELQPVEGALVAVQAITRAGLPVAVASNSAREELHAKLRRLGLAAAFKDRAFSFQDVPRPKPAPDMYLAAARACGVEPRDCVVVEDSLLGAQAGLAASCRVFGLTRETDASVFAGIGAVPFLRMSDLPGLLGLG